MFAIDVAAYAVMSNHYHVVVRINHEAAETWARDEVIERWRRLFTGPLLDKRYCVGDCLSKPELVVLGEIVAEWRNRLMDSRWFMRCLDDFIARQADALDGGQVRVREVGSTALD